MNPFNLRLSLLVLFSILLISKLPHIPQCTHTHTRTTNISMCVCMFIVVLPAVPVGRDAKCDDAAWTDTHTHTHTQPHRHALSAPTTTSERNRAQSKWAAKGNGAALSLTHSLACSFSLASYARECDRRKQNKESALCMRVRVCVCVWCSLSCIHLGPDHFMRLWLSSFVLAN